MSFLFIALLLYSVDVAFVLNTTINIISVIWLQSIIM